MPLTSLSGGQAPLQGPVRRPCVSHGGEAFPLKRKQQPGKEQWPGKAERGTSPVSNTEKFIYFHTSWMPELDLI